MDLQTSVQTSLRLASIGAPEPFEPSAMFLSGKPGGVFLFVSARFEPKDVFWGDSTAISLTFRKKVLYCYVADGFRHRRDVAQPG